MGLNLQSVVDHDMTAGHTSSFESRKLDTDRLQTSRNTEKDLAFTKPATVLVKTVSFDIPLEGWQASAATAPSYASVGAIPAIDLFHSTLSSAASHTLMGAEGISVMSVPTPTENERPSTEQTAALPEEDTIHSRTKDADVLKILGLDAPSQEITGYGNGPLSSRKRPTIPVQRNIRLPWLDGTRGSVKPDRHPSMPYVPGAFVEDDTRKGLNAASKDVQNGWPHTVDHPTHLVPLNVGPSVNPTDSMNSPERKTFEISTKTSGSLTSNFATPMPRPGWSRSPPELDTSHGAIFNTPGPAPVQGGQSRPAVPLISWAKELLPSNSSDKSSAKPLLTNLEKRLHSNAHEVPNRAAPLPPQPKPLDVALPSYHARGPGVPEAPEVGLNNSIDALDHLMQEAVTLAKEATDDNRGDEVPAILEEARLALEKSAHVHKNHEIAMMGPLRVSDSSSNSTHSSDITSSSDESEFYLRRSELDQYSKSIGRNLAGNQALRVHPHGEAGSGPHQEQRSNDSVLRTPPQFYHQPGDSVDTVALDWAYANPHGDPLRSPEVGPVLRRRSHVRVGRDENLAEPSTGQAPQRNQVDVLTRSLPAVDEPTSPGHGPIESTTPMEGGYGRRPTYGMGEQRNWGRDKYNQKDYMNSQALKGRHHLTLRDGQRFSLHHHRRQPIARNWSTFRKRFTATTACVNTALIGSLIGIYVSLLFLCTIAAYCEKAGEVPAIQYALTDQHHYAILGNVVLYLGMALITFFFWPLPLLHGRRPYTLGALAIALPLQFPQAVVIMNQRDPGMAGYRTGLLLSRALSGLALGFAHINSISTLLDLFGASLQSTHPHGEVVVVDDVRRHGGGMGLWIGVWSWCWIGSLAIGFMIGAEIISGLNVSWGFYITVILIAVTLLLDVITPETRRSPHRRTMQEIEEPNKEGLSRRLARGEIKMHIEGDGPKWWWEETTAGMYLSLRMLFQAGFALIAVYVAWIYAEIVLVIVLLGNLLSRDYSWRPQYVGLGVFSIAIGALLAVPLSKANIFSKSRSHGPRTDSMTFEKQVTWTSHMVRRFIFMIALPLAGLAYTLASAGSHVHYMVPIIFAAVIGFFSNLAIAECHGLIMETYDTSDLQPGSNSKHRLMSLPPATKRRRTAYSSYPRISAGFFVSQSLAFLFAAGATGVGGAVTRHVGAQKATAITAGILLGLTLLLTLALWRFKSVQVIPNSLFGSAPFGSDRRPSVESMGSARSWRAVVIGNPSGKVRKMSWLELGSLSRWTEIRRLNKLLTRSTTQGLTAGWQ